MSAPDYDHVRTFGAQYAAMAVRDAVTYHADDVRKDGSPYLGHLLRVAAEVADDPAAVVVALLHDIVEDHADVFNLHDIEVRYGADVAGLVDALTHRPNEPRVDYLTRVIDGGTVARRVKLADLVDNLTRLDEPGIPPADRLRLKPKYMAEVERLAPLVQDDRLPPRPALAVVDDAG